MAFQTSKMDQIALEYWYNSFLGRLRVDGRGFFYQKPILKKRSPDQKSRCRTCAEACHSPFKPCTASLCGKVSPCLWWSRLGFYLEDFVFHAFEQETHWPLLATVFCTLLTTLFLRTECPSWLSLWPLWLNSRAFVLLLSPGSEWSGMDPVLTRPVLSSGTSYYCTSCSLRFQNRFSSVFELLCVPRVFCYLLSLLKFLVNVVTIVFPPSAVGLIASIEGRLYFYLPLLFKRFRYRRRRDWGTNGCIGKVVGDSFHLCLS